MLLSDAYTTIFPIRLEPRAQFRPISGSLRFHKRDRGMLCANINVSQQVVFEFKLFCVNNFLGIPVAELVFAGS